MNIELFENLRVDAAFNFWRNVSDGGRMEPAPDSPAAKHFARMCKVMTQKEVLYLRNRIIFAAAVAA